MLLSSSAYFIFLVGIFFLFWPLGRMRALSLAVILLANYFFYAKWDLFYLVLIPLASTVDYLIGRALDASKNQTARKLLVTGSVLMNLGILVAFKYMPFLLENYAAVTGTTAAKWSWTFPLGISFYVFQSLSYTLDMYRRDAQPVKSYLAYLAAVSFFPTTLAGPITRPAQLAPQMDRADRSLDPADGGNALFLIGMGLMKKLLIADYLAENLVNRVFDFPNLYTGFETLIGVYGYAIQLYYDFSGYTDIAIGSALLLGFKLPPNFQSPYRATNIADFWRRWHISLSNWLRDYLFFSLPGARGKVLPYVNLTITMVLGGLWHGASWTFVVWGLLHGVALAITRYGQVLRRNAKPKLPEWLRVFVTVQFVCLAWVFFRASSLENALNVLSRIASLTFSVANISGSFAVVLTFAAAAHYFPKDWFERGRRVYIASPFYVQAAALMLLAIAIQYVAATGAAPFIYTKF